MFDPALVKLFTNTRVFLPQSSSGATNNLVYATHYKTNSDQGELKMD
jgi:hypothetical protein